MNPYQPRRIYPGIIPLISIVLLLCFCITGCSVGKQDVSSSSRPQEPVPPLPYQTELVRFENTREGIHLAGTLSLPFGEGPYPAIVLITGSGPQDRDETIAGGHKPFLILADYLTRRGIAVLRYDDRGVAGSSGDFASATMPDFASDARAAVEYLQSRQVIDSKRIGLVGHSEGGAVAPMVSIAMPGEIAFLILLGSSGIPGEQIFYLQDAVQSRAAGVDEAAIERSRARKEQIFNILKDESDLSVAKEKLRNLMKTMPMTADEKAEIEASGVNINRLINQQIRLLNTAAIRFFLTYDPIPALKQVNVPVLAITGENDLQVPPAENLPPVEAALADGNSPHYSVRELKGLNHLFQSSETGLASEYAQIKETFAPSALEVIGDWVEEILE